jgi:UDP-glucose 4-epimerase
MKIAIIGGTGFIGTYVTKAYLDAGHDVLVIDSLVHSICRTTDPRARFYHIDIRAPELRTILYLERPDIVSHHARQHRQLPVEQALTDADVHVRGLLNVLDSCVNACVKKIIFASGGCSLYGGYVSREQLPLAETAPLCPQSAHDINKVAGEWYVRYYTQQYGLKHTIVRYANVYGTGYATRIPHPIHYFVAMLLEQQRPVIREKGDALQDHIFIDDVVRANLCLLKRGENRTFHISSGQGVTLNQIYQKIAQELGSHLEPIYLPKAYEHETEIILDNSHAQCSLGWQPEISLHEGIRLTIARIREKQQQALPPPTAHMPIVRTEEIATTIETTLTHA